MACLQAPLTIISHHHSGGDGGGSSSHRQPFNPPAATWFDEDPLHFVALEARPNPRSGSDASTFRGSITSGVGSIDSSVLVSGGGGGVGHRGSNSSEGSGENNVHEIVRYQAFGLPKHDRRSLPKDNDEDLSRQPVISAFDAAKKAAQDNLKALTIEISVSFPLPIQLATVETAKADPSVMTEDDDTYATGSTERTVTATRRIPILAKFSPKMKNGMRFLAMQYTPTMVRIAMVEGQNKGVSSAPPRGISRRHSFSGSGPSSLLKSDGGSSSSNDAHWTIDLSYDAYPVVSKPECLPNFREGSARNLFGKAPKVEEGIVPGNTTIIGGGVIWFARGQKKQADDATSLDLILVTTTSVLVYNMNMVKRQLVKTHIFPHDLAASFWYEPISSTLMIGSYKSNSQQNSYVGAKNPSVCDEEDRQASMASFSIGEEEDHQSRPNVGTLFPSAVMSMKALFFDKQGNHLLVETFPTFTMGALREVVSDSDGVDERHELQLSLETFDVATLEKNRQIEDAESAVVLPTEIFVFNLYGSVYCIELGSLGLSQGGIGFTKLDREAGSIHVRHQKFETLKREKVDVESTISVGVIDNLLCIFSKKDQTSHFLDVEASFSDDNRVFRDSIEVFEPGGMSSGPHIHNEGLSFLAPSYFLDTNGQGLLYESVLSLPLLLQSVPPAACIIPFLQRRRLVSRTTIRTHIMERFSMLIEEKDMPTLQKWVEVIVQQYSSSKDALKFDFESTVALLSKCSLLSWDDMADAYDVEIVEHIMVPSSCGQVLTQTEVLQMVLLPHAMKAIKGGSHEKLEFITSLSVNYFVELERRFITPCIALQCLVIGLLWRTGENAELSSFLSAQQSQWTITRRRRQMNLPTLGRMYFDDPGATAFAETLFLIAKEDVSDEASKPCTPSTRRQLISHATIILLGCGATSLAARCLLSVGQLNEAISVCAKTIRPGKSTEGHKLAEGTQSKDFFRAAVSNARKAASISERCKSFYHLHFFLQQWDPSAFTLDSRKIRVSRRVSAADQMRRSSFRASEDLDTVVIEQSKLAHECPRFPDELFGGKESACCKKLRSMFGYVNNIK